VLLADKAAGHEVTITDTRSRPLKVLNARAGCRALQARVRGPGSNQKGQRTYSVAFAVADDYPEGRHDDTLVISTDDPKYAELRVPVTIVKRSQSRLSATPNEANVSSPAGQAIPSRIILIRDIKGERVKIEEIIADDPAVACTWAEGPNAMATVKVHLDYKRIRTGAFSSAVHVHISGPVRETLTIPVHYTASPSYSN
jgi:hypothetical protein